MSSANVVGSPQGLSIDLVEHTAAGFQAHNYVFNASGNGTGAVTYDWTTTTYYFTTASATRYINIVLGIYGNSSNYFDGTAWFDDIILKPTVNTGRAVASSRLAA